MDSCTCLHQIFWNTIPVPVGPALVALLVSVLFARALKRYEDISDSDSGCTSYDDTEGGFVDEMRNGANDGAYDGAYDKAYDHAYAATLEDYCDASEASGRSEEAEYSEEIDDAGEERDDAGEESDDAGEERDDAGEESDDAGSYENLGNSVVEPRKRTVTDFFVRKSPEFIDGSKSS